MELHLAYCQNVITSKSQVIVFIAFLLMGVCVTLDNNKTENITKSSSSESPDSDKLNILSGVFTLMLIVAVMSGVATCIVKGNQMEAEKADDNEEVDVTERTLLTSSPWINISHSSYLLTVWIIYISTVHNCSYLYEYHSYNCIQSANSYIFMSTDFIASHYEQLCIDGNSVTDREDKNKGVQTVEFQKPLTGYFNTLILPKKS